MNTRVRARPSNYESGSSSVAVNPMVPPVKLLPGGIGPQCAGGFVEGPVADEAVVRPGVGGDCQDGVAVIAQCRASGGITQRQRYCFVRLDEQVVVNQWNAHGLGAHFAVSPGDSGRDGHVMSSGARGASPSESSGGGCGAYQKRSYPKNRMMLARTQAEPFLGLVWSRLNVPPGQHQLQITIDGSPAQIIEKVVEVPGGGVARIEVAIPV